jgi:hypothetical protein
MQYNTNTIQSIKQFQPSKENSFPQVDNFWSQTPKISKKVIILNCRFWDINTIQYNTILYNTNKIQIRYNTNAMQYKYNTIQIIQCNTIQYNTNNAIQIQHNTNTIQYK